MKKILLIPILFLFIGCASWNLHTACFDVNGTNLVTPYGPASGNLRICSETCIGNCSKGDVTNVETLTNAEINVDKKAIGTIPVIATIVPTK